MPILKRWRHPAIRTDIPDTVSAENQPIAYGLVFVVQRYHLYSVESKKILPIVVTVPRFKSMI